MNMGAPMDAFAIIVPVAIGILLLPRRAPARFEDAPGEPPLWFRLPGRHRYGGRLGETGRVLACWRIVGIHGRAARLHSLPCVFMPPPRLLRRLEESIMLVGILVMSFANCATERNPYRRSTEKAHSDSCMRPSIS